MQLHQKFIVNAKKYPDRMAVIDRSTEKRITYSKALIASLVLSKRLKKMHDGFIGIMIPTSAGCMLSVLGVLMAGKVPVMINYSTGAAGNAEYAQKKCGFKTIIASKALLEKIGCRFVPGMIFIEDLVAEMGLASKLKAAVQAKLPLGLLLGSVHRGEMDDTLVILFTSGSEKDPKAVPLTHGNIFSNLEAFGQILDFGPQDILLANLPLFHVFGLTVDCWLPLERGMTIVTYPNPLESRSICTAIREEGVTVMVGTPAFLHGYLQKSETGDFRTIRLMMIGADKCPESLRRGWWDKHRIILYEGYGTTETSPVVSVNTPQHNRPGSVGQALPNVEVRLEHYDTGEQCGVNQIGKVLVKGPNVMKGYFDDFEASSLHLRHGWYDTGDMGYMDGDGYLWHVGRLRRFLKVGGEMVSLVKVEDVLERLLPTDCECCVVEVPDAMRGARIVAAVTAQIEERAILAQMGESLPHIALPKQFVVLPDLPKMTSGKLDFRRITEMVRDVVQERDRTAN